MRFQATHDNPPVNGTARMRRDELTDELTPDDGQDPVVFHDRRKWQSKPPGPGRKAMQLCGQVKDVLVGAVVEGVVISVEPCPHAGRLLVTVAVGSTADATDRAAALDQLNRQAGELRRLVAATVSRRKVPELVFAVG